MKFHRPLREGILLKRYKRFFADILFEGQTILAHVPNSGSMKGCSEPGSPCLFSESQDPKRKLRFTLEMVKSNQSWVGVNTLLPNKLVHEAFQNKTVPHWTQFTKSKGEAVIHANSRIDFAFWNGNEFQFSKKTDLKDSEQKFHFVEVKNVSLVENQIAMFPDSVTTRGQKHIADLMHLIDWGHTCELVFTVQRSDSKSFAPADQIDREYGKCLREGYKSGIRISPFVIDLSKTEAILTPSPLAVQL